MADELQAAIAEAQQYQSLAAQANRTTPSEVSLQVLVCVHHVLQSGFTAVQKPNSRMFTVTCFLLKRILPCPARHVITLPSKLVIVSGSLHTIELAIAAQD